jgi:hypothetical protein
MKNKQNYQSNAHTYINVIKNIARVGAGSALVLVHIAILGGTAILSQRALAKQQAKERKALELPYER